MLGRDQSPSVSLLYPGNGKSTYSSKSEALTTFGQYSPIGTRQEKLLHPIMHEIINMTTQEKPLSVGLPLYPFSLDSAFQREEKKAAALTAGSIGAVEDEAVAPLPDAAYVEDISMSDAPSIVVPSLPHGVGGLWARR